MKAHGVEWRVNGLPSEYRLVLVCTRPTATERAAVCVAYRRIRGDGDSFWVAPGVAAIENGVEFWSDCLGDRFSVPSWSGTEPGGPLDNRRNRSSAGG